MDISSLREREAGGVFTVSALNSYIKDIFEADRTLKAVTVKGEISNFTHHSTGHLYFTLKDTEGQIRAVMFRSAASRLSFLPESGMKVIVHGSVSVYARDGSYQIYVNSMQPDGIGALYLAYEQLKHRLSEEGLFDAVYKRAIPKYPKRIGVITSPSGAAVRDIINVTGRRFPFAEIIVYPSLVQGEGAEAELVAAVDYFDRTKSCDVIIIGRGGGSIEDLWAFNSEKLARRIFSATVPVISAVGHETDFTICDFVSDLRAPTPSAAAEIAVPDIRELFMRLDTSLERLSLAANACFSKKTEALSSITNKDIFLYPERIFLEMENSLSEKVLLLKGGVQSCLSEKANLLAIASEKLNVLSPLSVLSRGFSLVEKDGKTVKQAGDVRVGDSVSVRLYNGSFTARVEKTN